MYPSLMRFPGDLFADFEDLRRQMDRLFGARAGNSSIRAVQGGSFPAINVGTTPDAIEIYAFAPGIDASSLEVTVDKGLLTLSGERKAEQPEKNGKAAVYARERASGPFRRVVTLPEDADPDRVDATYRDGVLKIRLEKREASRPRRIEIRAAQ
jgi:HSP20 family protein